MVKQPNPRVAELMRLTGKTRLECAFIAAIESGEIDGDIVTKANSAVSLSSGNLEGGHWVTIDGQHVYVKAGKIVAGGSPLDGKKLGPAIGAHDIKAGDRVRLKAGHAKLYGIDHEHPDGEEVVKGGRANVVTHSENFQSKARGGPAKIDTKIKKEHVSHVIRGDTVHPVVHREWKQFSRSVSLSRGRSIVLAAHRAVDSLLAPLDLYRPDQPRDANGRFTADPGGNMRTQIRQHGTRADFHEKKAAAAKAKGNDRMAAAHGKLAASHRDIAKGLQEEHDLKHAPGPKPAEHFVPGKKADRPSHSAKDWESFDKAAGKSNKEHLDGLKKALNDEGEKIKAAATSGAKDAKGQNYFDHLAQAKKAANSGKPGEIAAPKAASSIADERARGYSAAASEKHPTFGPGETADKIHYHQKNVDALNQRALEKVRLYGNAPSAQADRAFLNGKAQWHREQAAKATPAGGQRGEGQLPADAAQRAKVAEGIRQRIAEGKTSAERSQMKTSGGQMSSPNSYLKGDPQRVVFIKGNTYENREMLRDMGATPVPGKGWAVTAGAAKGIKLPKGLHVVEYSRSLTLSSGRTIGYQFKPAS